MSAANAVDLEQARKFFATVRAKFAMSGFQLNRAVGGGFVIAKDAWIVDAPSIADVLRFAERAGIATG